MPLKDIRALFFERFSFPGQAFATYTGFIRELKLVRIRSMGEAEEQDGPLAASA